VAEPAKDETVKVRDVVGAAETSATKPLVQASVVVWYDVVSRFQYGGKTQFFLS